MMDNIYSDPASTFYKFSGIIGEEKIKGMLGRNSCAEVQGFLDFETRDKIHGVLINTQKFYFPGNVDRNFFIFAHYSSTEPNRMFYLAKDGRDFEGLYKGVMELSLGIAFGISPMHLIDGARYMDDDLKPDIKKTLDVVIELLRG